MDKGKNLTLNLDQFKKMGGKYIFSRHAVNINNGNGISFLRKFTDPNSKYDIHLYKVE